MNSMSAKIDLSYWVEVNGDLQPLSAKALRNWPEKDLFIQCGEGWDTVVCPHVFNLERDQLPLELISL